MQAKSGVSFNFTKLLVGDLDKSAAFYGAVFKLEELFRVEDKIEGREIREVMYQPTHEGAATFVLLSFEDAPEPVVGETITGFTVADLDQVMADVVANGGQITDPIRDMPEMGIRVGFGRDPEGHLIEVVQMLQA
jgi:predicted enzyme related to lactoylglutathione lyase